MGQNFCSCMSSLRGQSCHIPKEAVCGSDPSCLLPCTNHRESGPCRLCLPGFQVSLARGSMSRKKGEARMSPPSSLCLRGHLQHPFSSTRHSSQGCWVTQLPALVTSILSLTPQSRGLVASLLCSFVALCLASWTFHHLHNQFPLLNSLYLK